MPRRSRHKNLLTSLQNRGTEDRETRAANASALFQSYYQAQTQLFVNDDWEAFMTCLKSELPATFRLTGFRGHTMVLLEFLRKQAGLEALPDATESVPVPQPLPWYPHNFAWQLDVSRNQLRKVLELRPLHRLLVSETESGYMSRQEAVSMIPPLVLDLRHDSFVLDMCAAPGSKTAQLVEALHESAAAMGLSEPTGCVIANDVDNKRAYLMVHQVKRVQSPCVAVVNQDATIFPAFSNGETDAEPAFLFDRILVDAPCSGDGTLRKNPGIWDRWKPGLGINEHMVQCRLLRRGLELLKVGGRLVYSTCSLNPVENEAVVWRALLEAGPKVLRLVDARHLLPGLKSRPGMTHWRVMDKEGNLYDKHSDAPDDRGHQGYLRPDMFATESKDEQRSVDELRQCIRVMPHDQNSGGFFVAVFEKTGHLPWTRAGKLQIAADLKVDDVAAPPSKSVKLDADAAVAEDAVNATTAAAVVDEDEEVMPANNLQIPQWKKRSNRKTCIYKEEPFFFMTAEDKQYVQIRDFYGFSDTLDPTLLMYRCESGKRRNLYYTSPQLKRLLLSNPDIKWINLGVKMFSVCEDNDYHGYRLLQEGLELAQPLVTKRRLALCHDDTRLLLSHLIPFASQFCEACQAQWGQLSVGPVLLDFVPAKDDELHALHFVGWRGGTTLRCYLKRHERDHLLRLNGDTPPDELVSLEEDRAVHFGTSVPDAASGHGKDEATVESSAESPAGEQPPTAAQDLQQPTISTTIT